MKLDNLYTTTDAICKYFADDIRNEILKNNTESLNMNIADGIYLIASGKNNQLKVWITDTLHNKQTDSILIQPDKDNIEKNLKELFISVTSERKTAA